jgi:hypothetical protein
MIKRGERGSGVQRERERSAKGEKRDKGSKRDKEGRERRMKLEDK